ncbi:hypothetical protein GMRT_24843 [Giardia muris]|uniref:Uncharacterized protein n=1 Tax=Giardia muris TaxID=5742 RepID=A0A4Z1SLL1_GIAMU|nr:hypothetical protein GMRT_24843 [Giardia muris]|eukprot:TNJ26546.1 hypothetical protein GMRT_24843 [Giardia muris]
MLTCSVPGSPDVPSCDGLQGRRWLPGGGWVCPLLRSLLSPTTILVPPGVLHSSLVGEEGSTTSGWSWNVGSMGAVREGVHSFLVRLGDEEAVCAATPCSPSTFFLSPTSSRSSFPLDVSKEWGMFPSPSSLSSGPRGRPAISHPLDSRGASRSVHPSPGSQWAPLSVWHGSRQRPFVLERGTGPIITRGLGGYKGRVTISGSLSRDGSTPRRAVGLPSSGQAVGSG